MKPLTSALAALAVVATIAAGAPAVSASVSLSGGASGCCKDFV